MSDAAEWSKVMIAMGGLLDELTVEAKQAFDSRDPWEADYGQGMTDAVARMRALLTDLGGN
jgi:hypothetical protein